MAIPAYSGILDGKTFIGKNGEIGKSGPEDDEIKFETSHFTAALYIITINMINRALYHWMKNDNTVQ